jgi:quercetin dioxygenase-like cupin family protein
VKTLFALTFATFALGLTPSTDVAKHGAIVAMGQGEARISRLGSAEYLLKIDRQNAGSQHLVVWMERIAQGHRVPVHLHQNNDEIVIVHEGAVAAYLQGHRAILNAGDLLFAPHGTLLGFENVSHKPATLFFVIDDPTFDGFLRDVSVPAGEKATPLTFSQRKMFASRHHIRYRPDIAIVK